MLYICIRFHENISNDFLRYRADTSVWAIINEVRKPELWFLCSAHPIIVLYICMKCHENISNESKDTERTRMYGGNGYFQYLKGNNSRSRKTRVTVHVFCTSSHGV